MVGGNISLVLTQSLPDGTKLLKSGYNPNNDRYLNINTELKPMLEKRFENEFEGSKCENPILLSAYCPDKNDLHQALLGLPTMDFKKHPL